MVEGSVRAWWILDCLASNAETFDGGSLVTSSEGSACVKVSLDQ